jgi:metallo-beta-lactamase family protein
MTYPHIEHHGSRDGVTDSCRQLSMTAANSLLIDCRLFRGGDAALPNDHSADLLSLEFSFDTLKTLAATHVHIHHGGRVPYLLAARFDGPIVCSEPSAILLPFVLEDAFKLGFSRDQAQIDKYIRLAYWRTIAQPYQQWLTLTDTNELSARIRLQRAGHILGSAYVEIDLPYPQIGEIKHVVFSSDIGAPHAPFLMPPESPQRADILMLESTYGDRLQDRANRRSHLEAVIAQPLENQGSILNSAFSIGCTNELFYELEDIIEKARRNTVQPPLPCRERAGVRGVPTNADRNTLTTWPLLPVIIDSPLASRFTTHTPKPRTVFEHGRPRAHWRDRSAYYNKYRCECRQH